MDINHKLIDAALRDELAWHRGVTAAQSAPGSFAERRAFIRGLKQARFLLREVVKAQREKGK